MQIKTALRFPVIPVRMAKIKKIAEKSAGGLETPAPCWWDRKLLSHFGDQHGEFPTHLKTELPHKPAVPLSKGSPRPLLVGLKTANSVWRSAMESSQHI